MKKIRYIFYSALALLGFTSCVDNGDSAGETYHQLTVVSDLPEEVQNGEGEMVTGQFRYTELNTGRTGAYALPQYDPFTLPAGLYDIECSATVAYTSSQGTRIERSLRAVQRSVELAAAKTITLDWFFYDATNSLVFSEIYATGSLNATATGGIRDTYIRIYNNTSEIIYADGIGIAESAFVNARTNTFEILTEANDRQVNFTAGTIWVIPGSGTDYPIAPGESIKLVDQAINWNEQVAGGLDHTDADFEWVDDHAMDTDNPAVPNLQKWYCYSNTIWVISNQCNRSYALVKFPEGMTAEQYLAEYRGTYDYISAVGSQMTNDKAYLIPNDWILDGVNMGNLETWVRGALGDGLDISYASVSDIARDPERFGRLLARRVASTDNGVEILMDTNDSSNDFFITTPR